jgi:hypothetical protein
MVAGVAWPIPVRYRRAVRPRHRAVRRALPRTLAALAACALSAAALGGCPSPTPARGNDCASGRIGAGGGPLIGPVGMTMVFPPGALASDTDVRVCVLATTPVAHQRSATYDIQPHDARIAAPIALTVPVQGVLSSPSATIGDGPTDPAPSTIADVRGGSGAATFSITRLGVVRVLDQDPPDGGPPDMSVDGSFDAPFIPRDMNPSDAWAPPPPVVVGADHAPADYTCLGTRATPARGAAPQRLTVRVRDWADHGPRDGYQMRVLESVPPDAAPTCGTIPGCLDLTSDALGEATASLRSGWLFFDVTSATSPTDDAHTPFPQLIAQRVLDPSATTIDLAVVSQRTFFALSGGMGPSTWAYGVVHDCAGMPVQRARVRAIDPATNRDLPDVFGVPTLRYGTGSGFPASGTTRSGSDGVYMALASGGAVRLEVWGVLGSGDEVLLGCDSVDFTINARPVLIDLDPLRSDADPACGTAP